MPKRVAYLGPPGTYSDEAVGRYAPDSERISYPSLAHVAGAVEDGEVDEAVAPIENSIQGSITDILDFLIQAERTLIRGELVLTIDNCLLALPGTEKKDIGVVFSHPQPLGQCRNYLRSELPNARLVASLSTISAVMDLKNSGETGAAIAPRGAASIYDLEILDEGIQDNRANMTRFVVLAPSDHARTGRDKTSIAFDFSEDASGLLHEVMRSFAERDISLTRVESRPTGFRLGRYIFLMDFEGHRADADVADALRAVREQTSMLKILGSYPRAEVDLADLPLGSHG